MLQTVSAVISALFKLAWEGVNFVILYSHKTVQTESKFSHHGSGDEQDTSLHKHRNTAERYVNVGEQTDIHMTAHLEQLGLSDSACDSVMNRSQLLSYVV